MDFFPAESKEFNAVAVYRETLGSEESDKIHMKVRVNDSQVDHRIKDAVLAYKTEIWQLVSVSDINDEVEVTLTCDKKETSLILPKCEKSVLYTAVPTPLMEGNFLALYLVPFFSYFQVESSNTVFLQIAKSNNIWIESLAENTSLLISLKSPLWSEGVNNEVTLNIQDFNETFDYQFVSYTLDDKIVIKCMEEGKLAAVGILKLREIADVQPGKSFQSSLQIGYNSCQVWLTVNPRKRDLNEIKAEGHAELAKTTQKLTFKDPVFLDVLELLEFKINKMKNKNLMVTTQNNKISTKNEWLKKKITELERAPNLSDYKKAEAKKTVKTDAVKKEVIDGICSCGRPNPRFKGYCEECVKLIKADYERVFNWFSPIEKKHKDLEDKFININGRKILLELKIKRLEERIARPIALNDDTDIETAAQLKASLKKLQEDIVNLQQDSENTADMYLKQEQQINKEISRVMKEKESGVKVIQEMNSKISSNEEVVAQAKERLVFKQYFNEKYK
jgi:hypothetical protein